MNEWALCLVLYNGLPAKKSGRNNALCEKNIFELSSATVDRKNE